MKTWLILLIAVFAFSVSAVADDTYLITYEDNSVSILSFRPGSGDTIEEALAKGEYGNVQARKIKPGDITADEDYREFWFYNAATSKVEVDNAAKQAYLDEVSDAETARDAILQKIIDKIPGLTAKDLKDIGIKKDVKVKKEK